MRQGFLTPGCGTHPQFWLSKVFAFTHKPAGESIPRLIAKVG